VEQHRARTGTRKWRVAAILAFLTVLVGAPVAQAGKGPAFQYTYVGHIGSRGNAPGQFAGTSTSGPGGIAVEQGCGNVYIGDLARGVVYRYDENGKFLNQIGTRGQGPGQTQEPAGIFIDSPGVTPLNLHGPPQHCAGFFAMGPLVWIADYGDHRIPVFDQSGQFKGAWCNTVGNTTGCDVTRGGRQGFDYNPNDVWVNGDSVYVAGRLGNEIKQYNRSGDYIRSTDNTQGAAYSLAAQGTQLWSTYGNSRIASFSLNPTSPTMNLVHAFGTGFSNAPGQFANPKGIWIGYDGTLYVLDYTRVQVFSPSGIYLSAIKLPKRVRGVDVATRYDGTVYVSDALGYGADVYSPGPIVNLKKVPGARDEIVLGARVTPSHRGNRIVLERITGNGWRRIVKLRLDRRSSVRYRWHPPRRNFHYQVRASFKDPHRYHADRASAIIDVASR
jgi:hypothetical protein